MKENYHSLSQLPDYVLDLLSSGDRRQVELHLSSCFQCRLALHREIITFRQVRSAVRRISQPDLARLQKLMPPIPVQGRTRWPFLIRQQLAPPAALLAILLSGWLWQAGPSRPLALPSSTPLLEATMSTGSPGSTTMHNVIDDGESPLFTIVAGTPEQQAVTVTTAPHPTPPEELP